MDVVEISEDLFTEMVFDRVAEYGNKFYDMDFWDAAIGYFEGIGWNYIDINDRDPMVIVDNIAVNGEIYTLKEVIKILKDKEYIDENNDEKSILEKVERYAENNGWDVLHTKNDETYYIVNWGF